MWCLYKQTQYEEATTLLAVLNRKDIFRSHAHTRIVKGPFTFCLLGEYARAKSTTTTGAMDQQLENTYYTFYAYL